jgi:mannose-6-phosphate isomerase-like protein (cupin superfamily)
VGASDIDEGMVTEGVILLLPGEGHRIRFHDMEMIYKASGEEADGAWTLVEHLFPPRFRAPELHRHEDARVFFYILSGTMTFQVEAQTLQAPAGSVVLVPPGVLHTFSNPEPVAAMCLMLTSAAGGVS